MTWNLLDETVVHVCLVLRFYVIDMAQIEGENISFKKLSVFISNDARKTLIE